MPSTRTIGLRGLALASAVTRSLGADPIGRDGEISNPSFISAVVTVSRRARLLFAGEPAYGSRRKTPLLRLCRQDGAASDASA